MKFILAIDQSTQGTKAVLFDANGKIKGRYDLPHRQILNEKGWVSHDPLEIYENVIKSVEGLIKTTGVEPSLIKGVGICNQRETTVMWDKEGKPICDAIVWQCNRATHIAEGLKEKAEEIYKKTGLPLSPFFPASKIKWILDHEKTEKNYKAGTIDTWILYKLTKGKSYFTDFSNASRTQLFNTKTLSWDRDICGIFGINPDNLPEIKDSNADFGMTDFEGMLKNKIPIMAVMGDSHSALFAQGCHDVGMVKATYGTGSSVMMNTGRNPIESYNGLATSVAWSIDGKADFVLEGNINYAGGVITWLKDKMGIISSVNEIKELINNARNEDETVFIPAFTGLSAPYWNSEVKATITGMDRNTGKEEIVKAAVESIAFQIMDVIKAMEEDLGRKIELLRTDGGATDNEFLMQFQSDLIRNKVQVSQVNELSATGVAYLAGVNLGIYKKEEIFRNISYNDYRPVIDEKAITRKVNCWKNAVNRLLY